MNMALEGKHNAMPYSCANMWDEAVLDVVFGKFKPQGHLPIELPSSMEAVRHQKEDVPYDSKDPLYPIRLGPG